MLKNYKKRMVLDYKTVHKNVVNSERHNKGTFLLPLSIILFLSLFSSCKVDKFLQKDQYIVGTNKINLKNVSSNRTRTSLQTDLATLYKQRDLPDILVGKSTFGVWVWYKKKENPNPKRFQRWLYNTFANEPAIYDPKQREATQSLMVQYLRNIGYPYPSVQSDHDYKSKDKGLATLTYTVNPGVLYVIDSLNFICNDTEVSYLLNDTKDKTLLSKGQPIDIRLFEQEKQRITTELNNFGYARFNANYITQFEGDTTDLRFNAKGERLVNLSITVQTPNNRPNHQRYKTGQVTIFPNYDARLGEPTQFDTTIQDKKIFRTYDGRLGIKLDPLSNAIPLTENQLFSKEKTEQSIRLLTNLGMYKFVNIKPDIDKSDTSSISYKIYLTPAQKMSFDGGVELNYSNINAANNNNRLGRIGLATDLGFIHRNLFGGAERFNSRFSFGLDRQLAFSAEASGGLSYDLRFENALSIPKFINLSKSWLFFNQIGLVKSAFYKDLKENSSSDLTLSYVLSDRLSLALYRIQQFNLGTRYVLKRKNGSEQYSINPTGVELQLAKLDIEFEAKADERLKRSLTPQLMTGLAARSLRFERSSATNKLGERWQFIGQIEQSGLEILLLEKFFNSGNDFKVGENLPFSKFLRGEIDLRYNRQLAAKRTFAARLSLGIAESLGSEPVPYLKQFFVGGPNSIRGWVIRDIGPGGFFDITRETVKTKTFPFQAGDAKFEFNSEFRFPLFWRFNSAVLFDAGNIWNLKKDEKLPNGNIDKFWFDQIAISSGIGLRLDVTYATIRFDFGFKLREPYERDGVNWIPLKDYSWRKNVTPNFALGFPF
ncbi:MAG: BamA/TamA family outer membrane protein [Saprospiraceae bacterium]|nr:BamA/TamA family outer membrane protein [Saprospiraceae bacterium]